MTHQPRTAQRVLESLSISRPAEIDLEAIAWLSGAKVKFRELDGCDACIAGRADVGRAIISIDSRALPRRQRFSLAHEIGHWEWHRGQHLMCSREDIGGSGRTQGLSREASANRFASELLMPGFMLKGAMRDFKSLDMRTVREMAAHFDVSLTAMAYRLVESDVQPSLLVAYGGNGRRRWFVSSKSIAKRWFPKDILDRQSGAYDILFNGAQDDGYMSTVEGDTWFNVDWADKVEVGEQSYRTQDDEVVTLLVAKSPEMLAD